MTGQIQEPHVMSVGMYINNHPKRWQGNTTQQKGKATQLCHFSKKIRCLRWDSNPRPSAFQACMGMAILSIVVGHGQSSIAMAAF